MLPSSDVHGRGPLSRPTPLLLQHGLLTASSCAAELTGSLMLQLLAGSTLSPTHIAAVYAGLMACFAHHSGGHLNPAMTLAAALSGHLAPITAGLYVICQICGALAGAMLQVAIIPGLAFGKISAPACHGLAAEVGGMPLFVWEAFAVFVLCYVAFPVSFTRPSYGGAGPVVLFLALLGALSTAGPYTGFSPLNPALSVAGTVVFNCAWNSLWVYLLAQFTGAAVAALVGVGVFGTGPALMSEEERAGYLALSGAADPEVVAGVVSRAGARLAGLSLESGTAAAPSGPAGSGAVY